MDFRVNRGFKSSREVDPVQQSEAGYSKGLTIQEQENASLPLKCIQFTKVLKPQIILHIYYNGNCTLTAVCTRV